MSRNSSFYFLLPVLALALNSCSKKSESQPSALPQVVATVDSTPVADTRNPVVNEKNEIVRPGIPAGSVSSKVTFEKATILNRTFLYGASLQFSSIVEDEIATAMMGLSLTALPANFRILDNKLR